MVAKKRPSKRANDSAASRPTRVKRADVRERLLATVLQNSLDAIMIHDFAGNIITWNRGAEQLYGYSEAEALRMNVGQLVVDELRPEIHAIWERLCQGEAVDSWETRRLTKDGRVLDVWVTAVVLSDKVGQPVAIAKIDRDITERKKAEKALQESEKHLAADLEAMTVLQKLGTFFGSEGNLAPVLGKIVDAAMAITGADSGSIQLLDPKSTDLKIEAQRGFPDWWIDCWQRICKGKGACGVALEGTQRVTIEDIEQSPIFVGTPALEMHRRAGIRALQCTPLITRSGKLLGMFSTHFRAPHRLNDHGLRLLDLLARQAADIIEQAQNEAAIRENEKRFRAFLENSLTIAWAKDADGQYVYLSRNFEKRFGVCQTDWFGKTDFDLWPREVAEIFRANDLAVLRDNRTIEVVEEAPNPDGSISWWLISKFAYHDALGRRYVGGLGVDITERVQAEMALRESRAKLEQSQEELARRLAERTTQLTAAEDMERRRLTIALHDSVAQTLALLKINLARHAADGYDNQSRKDVIEKSLDLLNEAINQIRGVMFDLYPTTLDDLGLIATLRQHGRELNARTGVQVVVSEIGDQQQLQPPIMKWLFRACKELITNAIKHGDARKIAATIHWQPSVVRIVMDDDGRGFDPGLVPQPRPDHGLGLVTIRERLFSLGGQLSIESQAGHGARFIMDVPLGDP